MKQIALKNNFGKGMLMVFISMLFASCQSETAENDTVNFDRKAMLENWADELIMPAYQDFEFRIDTLHKSIDALAQSDSKTQLEQTQQLFEEAYLSFQYAKIYEVGPAANLAFRSTVNTFPADTQKVLANIQTGSYNFGGASMIDAQGFPAMEYLLFAKEIQVLNDSSTQSFLQQAADHIHHQVRQILEAWQNGYRSDFVAATGTDIGSSLGQVVNAINKDYEVVKNAKIGFPAGKRSMGQPYPYTAEAPYSNLSLDLAIANVEAVHQLYLGTGFNSGLDGPSLQEYLVEMQTDNGSREPLDEDIHQTLLQVIRDLEEINGPLTSAVFDDKDAVTDAYNSLVDGVILLKSEMPSVLGVLITYQDNDGD